jgi:hypothetical protein
LTFKNKNPRKIPTALKNPEISGTLKNAEKLGNAEKTAELRVVCCLF